MSDAVESVANEEVTEEPFLVIPAKKPPDDEPAYVAYLQCPRCLEAMTPRCVTVDLQSNNSGQQEGGGGDKKGALGGVARRRMSHHPVGPQSVVTSFSKENHADNSDDAIVLRSECPSCHVALQDRAFLYATAMSKMLVHSCTSCQRHYCPVCIVDAAHVSRLTAYANDVDQHGEHASLDSQPGSPQAPGSPVAKAKLDSPATPVSSVATASEKRAIRIKSILCIIFGFLLVATVMVVMIVLTAVLDSKANTVVWYQLERPMPSLCPGPRSYLSRFNLVDGYASDYEAAPSMSTFLTNFMSWMKPLGSNITRAPLKVLAANLSTLSAVAAAASKNVSFSSLGSLDDWLSLGYTIAGVSRPTSVSNVSLIDLSSPVYITVNFTVQSYVPGLSTANFAARPSTSAAQLANDTGEFFRTYQSTVFPTIASLTVLATSVSLTLFPDAVSLPFTMPLTPYFDVSEGLFVSLQQYSKASTNASKSYVTTQALAPGADPANSNGPFVVLPPESLRRAPSVTRIAITPTGSIIEQSVQLVVRSDKCWITPNDTNSRSFIMRGTPCTLYSSETSITTPYSLMALSAVKGVIMVLVIQRLIGLVFSLVKLFLRRFASLPGAVLVWATRDDPARHVQRISMIMPARESARDANVNEDYVEETVNGSLQLPQDGNQLLLDIIGSERKKHDAEKYASQNSQQDVTSSRSAAIAEIDDKKKNAGKRPEVLSEEYVLRYIEALKEPMQCSTFALQRLHLLRSIHEPESNVAGSLALSNDFVDEALCALWTSHYPLNAPITRKMRNALNEACVTVPDYPRAIQDVLVEAGVTYIAISELQRLIMEDLWRMTHNNYDPDISLDLVYSKTMVLLYAYMYLTLDHKSMTEVGLRYGMHKASWQRRHPTILPDGKVAPLHDDFADPSAVNVLEALRLQYQQNNSTILDDVWAPIPGCGPADLETPWSFHQVISYFHGIQRNMPQARGVFTSKVQIANHIASASLPGTGLLMVAAASSFGVMASVATGAHETRLRENRTIIVNWFFRWVNAGALPTMFAYSIQILMLPTYYGVVKYRRSVLHSGYLAWTAVTFTWAMPVVCMGLPFVLPAVFLLSFFGLGGMLLMYRYGTRLLSLARTSADSATSAKYRITEALLLVVMLNIAMSFIVAFVMQLPAAVGYKTFVEVQGSYPEPAPYNPDYADPTFYLYRAALQEYGSRRVDCNLYAARTTAESLVAFLSFVLLP